MIQTNKFFGDAKFSESPNVLLSIKAIIETFSICKWADIVNFQALQKCPGWQITLSTNSMWF
jgi:hypothetical protein